MRSASWWSEICYIVLTVSEFIKITAMIEDQESLSPPIRQPQSLRSLASLTSRNNQQQHHEHHEHLHHDSQKHQLAPVEPELKQSSATFVDIESDLGTLFGSIPLDHNADYLNSSIPVSQSFSRGEYEEEIRTMQEKLTFMEKEMFKAKDSIEKLEIDNIDLSEGIDDLTKKNKQLKHDKDALLEVIQELKSNVKEKEEELLRTEKGRTMLLSKVGTHDTLKEENTRLTQEIFAKEEEIAKLQQRETSNLGRSEQLKAELDKVSNDLKSSQMEVERRKNEFESKRIECENLKDTLSSQKIDGDREIYRLETKLRDLEKEVRRLEDLNRSLQIDGNDRSNVETRLRSEVGAVESRAQQLEDDNASLRRRIFDITEGKDREISQALMHSSSLERANRNLTEEVNQLRHQMAQQGGNGVAQDYGSLYPTAHHKQYSHRQEYPTAQQHHAPPPPDLSSRSLAHNKAQYHRGSYSAADIIANNAESSSSLNSDRMDNNSHGNSDTSFRIFTAKSDEEHPSHLASSLDYNSRREKELKKHDDNNNFSKFGSKSTLRGYSNSSINDCDTFPKQTETAQRSGNLTAVRSLASLVSGGNVNVAKSQSSLKASSHQALSSSSPFATAATESDLQSFDELESQLTALMSEKSDLTQELERLHQRGGKTLKERTRFVQVEARLDALGKEIGRARRALAKKPH